MLYLFTTTTAAAIIIVTITFNIHNKNTRK
jgi:hypothetical protein